MSEKTIVLSPAQIEQKLERMIHEIHEKCHQESELIICGIEGNGTLISKQIATRLEQISDIKTLLCSIKINKDNPLDFPSELSISSDLYKNKTIIVVDDVSNSGKTLIYAVKHFMDQTVKSIRTFVLVDRNHNRYPVSADFVGLSISTTLKERIEVDMTGENQGVFLV
jgi:pyrimidine operon attenuation protein/uracil phosphoribosyltransferase